MKKILSLILILSLAVIIWIIFRDQLTLTNLQDSLGSLRSYATDHWLIFTLAFVAVYVTVTAASLPFASVLTLLAGAIFGFFEGLIIVSFSATLGSVLAFLATRYIARDWVQNRYGQRLETINEGIETDGALYLFTLRTVPVFPFFIVNLLMALTPIKLWTYIWVSWLGMLPGTAVYVYAGQNLAEINNLSDILSANVLLSLTLIGLTPLIGKFLLTRYQNYKIYRKFKAKGIKKPRKFDRNLVVIGAGSAGLVSAYMASTSKAKVTLVESNLMGGDCLNYGCVPSKTLIKSAKVAHSINQAEKYGFKKVKAELDVKNLSNNILGVVEAIAPNDSVERYQQMGVDVVLGKAKIIDPWHVEITTQKDKHPIAAMHDSKEVRGKDTVVLSTQSVVIATGAEPFVPKIEGLADLDYLTSSNLWSKLSEWKQMPDSLLILGGGNIGCEMAQSFSRLGVDVTLVEMADRVLVNDDPLASEAARNILEHDGVKVLTNHKAIRFDSSTCFARCKDKVIQIPFNKVIVALGRKARTEDIGLENLGIVADRFIKTNKYLQTNLSNIYAAGDVIAPYQLTHSAAYEGTYAALNALFGQIKKFKMDYRVIPSVTFLDPEIARVGLNEEQAKNANIDFDLTYYPLSKLDRAETEQQTNGFIKILTYKNKDKILGATVVAPHAGEIISELALAMKNNLGLRKILNTVHPYPTWSEAVKNVAGQWSKTHINERYFRVTSWYLKRKIKSDD